jgi:hypothetical protein
VKGYINPTWSGANFASGEHARVIFKRLSQSSFGSGVYLINVSSQINSDRDSTLAAIYSNGVCFSDGLPLTKLLHKYDPEFKQMRGIDLMKTILDDIGHTKFDKLLKNIFLFILPKYGLSYKEKFLRIFKYIFFKKTVSNEIFSPMELYTSKHGASMKIIENFWYNKLKLEKVVYYGAFSV